MTIEVKGDWMQTASGRAFWPLDPRAEDIDLGDIAHALSMQCRYAGHCREFYSVAEHCVLMAQVMGTLDARRWALMHDASEAYLVDVPRPVKPFLSNYKNAEARLMQVIAKRFDLAPTCPAEVEEADNRILLDEQRALMAAPPMPWNISGAPLGVRIMNWSPAQARSEFMAMAERLGLR